MAAYRGVVRAAHPPRRPRPQLVTQARRSKSEDIAYRQRRYLIMMGVRAVCFVIAVLLYVAHAGWLLTGIPAVAALVLPYFAVVFANGGREPDAPRGFREYQPRLPERYIPPSGDSAYTANTGNAGTYGTPPGNSADGPESGQREV